LPDPNYVSEPARDILEHPISHIADFSEKFLDFIFGTRISMTLLGHSVGTIQFQQRFGTKKALVPLGREELHQKLADNLMASLQYLVFYQYITDGRQTPGCPFCRKSRKAKRMHGDGQLFY
jgi:hypothetical protein